MNLASKTFKDNKTGQIVKVLDSFDNIAILENKDKVDVRNLMNQDLYTEQIDVNNFFNNQGAYNSLADKIKNISTENLRDDPSDMVVNVGGEGLTPTNNESAIMMISEDDEKAELAKKYGLSVDNVSPTQRQNEAFAKILGEGSEDELPHIEPIQSHNVSVRSEFDIDSIQQIEVNREFIPHQSEPIHVPIVEDPIITMFKGVKRGVEFKMNVEISNKIPRIDFIEMMEDSYSTSIIDFLADEFTNNLLKNPQIIKDMISDRIKQVVYGGEIKLHSRLTPMKDKETKKPVVKKVKKQKVFNSIPPKGLGNPVNKIVKESVEAIDPVKPSKVKKDPKDRKLREGSLPEKPNPVK